MSLNIFDLQISLLIPECGVLPAEIAKVISNFSSYHLVRDLPVYRFLEEDMLEIIKKGKVKDCVLLPQCKLFLFHFGSVLKCFLFYFHRQFLCTLVQNQA